MSHDEKVIMEFCLYKLLNHLSVLFLPENPIRVHLESEIVNILTDWDNPENLKE